MATFLTDPTTLDEIVLREVRQHQDLRPSEVLHSLERRGLSRSELKQAFVRLLNEGDLVLTADRRLKTPLSSVPMALAQR